MIKGVICDLRAIEKSDVTNYYNWVNDSNTNQWRGLHHPTSKEEAEDWIQAQRAKRGDALSLSIDSKGRHIGFIGIRSISSRSQRAEIWIYIGDKDFWNKGIGEDATKALCQYTFSEMNLFRIWLECNPEFKQVVKCYEKVGFKKEGLLRKAYYRNGKFHDTCIMGLLRTDWG